MAGKSEIAELGVANQFIDLIGNYLDVSEHWMKLIEDEDLVIFLVAEGIAEVYKEKGEANDAIPELEEMAQRFADRPRVATAIHFKLRDLYKESGDWEKALKQAYLVVLEKVSQ